MPERTLSNITTILCSISEYQANNVQCSNGLSVIRPHRINLPSPRSQWRKYE